MPLYLRQRFKKVSMPFLWLVSGCETVNSCNILLRLSFSLPVHLFWSFMPLFSQSFQSSQFLTSWISPSVSFNLLLMPLFVVENSALCVMTTFSRAEEEFSRKELSPVWKACLPDSVAIFSSMQAFCRRPVLPRWYQARSCFERKKFAGQKRLKRSNLVRDSWI